MKIIIKYAVEDSDWGSGAWKGLGSDLFVCFGWSGLSDKASLAQISEDNIVGPEGVWRHKTDRTVVRKP